MTYGSAPAFAFPELTPAIKRLLIVNGIVFLANAILGGELGVWFAVSWSGLWDGYGLGLLRLVTYQFTHAFESIGHILFNMLALYFFGTMAERSLGYLGTFKLYLLGGVVAAAVHLLLAAALGQGAGSLIGASGACFAFLVYAACMAPRAMVIFIIFPIPLGILAAGLVLIGLYSQYVELRMGASGGVSHSAHLGGAAFGFAAHRLGWFRDFRPYGHEKGLLGGLGNKLRSWRQQRQADSAHAQQQEVDRILEKIQQHGMPSLSSGERRILERASSRAKKK
ncbi:MAG: rhomboid family intramembrane serine protease [Planctomycetota bacterium]